MDICHKKHEELQYECSPLCCTLYGINAPYGGFAKLLEEWYDSRSRGVNDVYFTHSDHLGSASWITDNSGKPIQYLHYAPYGDLVANQRLGGYNERFKFTGKERDGESGYDFFGARYYTPPLGIWISVDPLTDRTIRNNPYMYCSGNPIIRIDPDGCKDVKMIRQGMKYLLFGGANMVSGVIIISVATGGTYVSAGTATPVTSPATAWGAVTILGGWTESCSGIYLIVEGYRSDPGPTNDNIIKNTPTSFTNALAKIVDQELGNETPIIEYGVEAGKLCLGWRLSPQTVDEISESIMNGVDRANVADFLWSICSESLNLYPSVESLSQPNMSLPIDNTMVIINETIQPIPYE